MGHKSELKKRKKKHLPPEELLRILRGIYPEEIAVQLFEELLSERGSNVKNN